MYKICFFWKMNLKKYFYSNIYFTLSQIRIVFSGNQFWSGSSLVASICKVRLGCVRLKTCKTKKKKTNLTYLPNKKWGKCSPRWWPTCFCTEHPYGPSLFSITFKALSKMETFYIRTMLIFACCYKITSYLASRPHLPY